MLVVPSEITDPISSGEPELHADHLMDVWNRWAVFGMNAIKSFHDASETCEIRVVIFNSNQAAWLPTLKAWSEGDDGSGCTEDRRFRRAATDQTISSAS